MQQHRLSILMPALIGGFALSIGLGGLSQSWTPVQDRSLIGGSYQRAVEARFNEELPLRSASVAVWGALRLALFNEPAAGAVLTADGWLFTAEEFTAPSGPDFAQTLKDTAEALQGRGIALIPVIVPDKARIYADRLDHARSPALEARYDAALAQIAAADLPSVDLRPALHSVNGDSFMRTDTHWSPLGAQAAAAAIAPFMAGFGSADAAFQTEFQEPALFEGDLMQYVETGPFARWVGPQAETIRSAITSAQAGADSLFGAPEIAVALVGTSYSAKADFNFDGFLRQESRRDLINYALQGEGPFVPMTAFLASEAVASDTLSLVIWEIPERYIAVSVSP